MQDLKRLDKNLGVKFNGETFVITYQRPFGDPVNNWKVVDDRGGFRQPDRRDIEILQQSDIEKESPKEKFARTAKYMEEAREKDRKRASEDIRHMTLDNRRQLGPAFSKMYGQGKNNSTFRRVNA